MRVDRRFEVLLLGVLTRRAVLGGGAKASDSAEAKLTGFAVVRPYLGTLACAPAERSHASVSSSRKARVASVALLQSAGPGNGTTDTERRGLAHAAAEWEWAGEVF